MALPLLSYSHSPAVFCLITTIGVNSYRLPARGSNSVEITNFLLLPCFYPKGKPSTNLYSRNIPTAITPGMEYGMEKSSSVHRGYSPRSRMTPRNERERKAVVPPRSHRQRQSKTSRIPETALVRKERLQKEKPETNEVTGGQEAEMKVNSTVVDIDSVRDDEVKEENLGLLEAAEHEDGKWKPEVKPGTYAVG